SDRNRAQQGVYLQAHGCQYLFFPFHSRGITRICGIVRTVLIQIRRASSEPDRILRNPPSDPGIIVSRAKSNQLSIRVIKTASESEWLKAREAGNQRCHAKLVIVPSLHDCVACRTDNKTYTAEMVRDDPIAASRIH